MTIGAADTWSSSRDEIIADACANVGAIGPGEEAAGNVRTFCARALDRLVKSIDAEGQFLWRIERKTLTTTAATASYALHVNTWAVDEPMNYRVAAETTRTPLYPMTRDEYMALPDRTTAGRPSKYYLEKSLTGNGRTLLTAYFWPVPDTSGDVIEYAAALRSKDFDTGATTPDFPTSWTKCLVYGLTAEIAPAFGQPNLVMTYLPQYQAELTKQVGSDTEQMNLTIVPFGGGSYY